MSDPTSLAGLIARFLCHLDQYLKAAQLKAINENLLRPTAQQLSLPRHLRTPPSQHILDSVVKFDGETHRLAAEMKAVGESLTPMLVAHGHDPRGVLLILHRARDGGGGPKAVLEIWESVKIDLQQIALLPTSQAANAEEEMLPAPLLGPVDELCEWCGEMIEKLTPLIGSRDDDRYEDEETPPRHLREVTVVFLQKLAQAGFHDEVSGIRINQYRTAAQVIGLLRDDSKITSVNRICYTPRVFSLGGWRWTDMRSRWKFGW